MTSTLIIIIGFVETLAIAAFLWIKFGKKASDSSENVEKFAKALEDRQALENRFNEIADKLAPVQDLLNTAQEYFNTEESLKAERGRIAITQAELDTVEVRLRDLDVIERELEASNLETQHELEILEKKKVELTNKRDSLFQRLYEMQAKINDIMQDTEGAELIQSTVTASEDQLFQAKDTIDKLLETIQAHQDQYIGIKQRYDALDIEYAQLYEKITTAADNKENKEG